VGEAGLEDGGDVSGDEDREVGASEEEEEEWSEYATFSSSSSFQSSQSSSSSDGQWVWGSPKGAAWVELGRESRRAARRSDWVSAVRMMSTTSTSERITPAMRVGVGMAERVYGENTVPERVERAAMR
jgi:hypothetical protein